MRATRSKSWAEAPAAEHTDGRTCQRPGGSQGRDSKPSLTADTVSGIGPRRSLDHRAQPWETIASAKNNWAVTFVGRMARTKASASPITARSKPPCVGVQPARVMRSAQGPAAIILRRGTASAVCSIAARADPMGRRGSSRDSTIRGQSLRQSTSWPFPRGHQVLATKSQRHGTGPRRNTETASGFGPVPRGENARRYDLCEDAHRPFGPAVASCGSGQEDAANPDSRPASRREARCADSQ